MHLFEKIISINHDGYSLFVQFVTVTTAHGFHWFLDGPNRKGIKKEISIDGIEKKLILS